MALTLPVVTIEGTLTADPTLNFTGSGAAVSNVNIACNTRRKNQQTDQWEDGDPTFVRGTVWKDLAENVAESLAKGDRVLAHGVWEQKDFTDKEGQKRTAYELKIEAIGPSLRWATAKVTKASKGGGGGSRQSAPAQNNGWGGDSDEPGW
jgi:single-strand DNA-binding protein